MLANCAFVRLVGSYSCMWRSWWRVGLEGSEIVAIVMAIEANKLHPSGVIMISVDPNIIISYS
jgi:hypothetical protein